MKRLISLCCLALLTPHAFAEQKATSNTKKAAQTTKAKPKIFQTGYAVYYGGRRDKSTKYTAAHLTLPFGTWVKVTHRKTGRTVTVKINDRGPFNNPKRIIDISRVAAKELGILREGVAPVSLTIIHPKQLKKATP